MGKESGMGAHLYVNGVHLSDDIRSVAIASPRGVQDVTPINKSGHARQLLTRDGSMGLSVFWDPDVAHAEFSALPTTDVPVMYVHLPTVGEPAASMVAKQVGYDPTRDANGAISEIVVQTLANGYGLEWGRMLTAGISEIVTAGAGTALDYGAGVGTTLFGLQAYLHVFAFAGTSATVAIQHSDDGDPGGAGDAYANVTNGAFNAASGVGSQRLQTDRDESVKQFLRVNVTGTFSDFHFAVAVTRNLEEVLF